MGVSRECQEPLVPLPLKNAIEGDEIGGSEISINADLRLCLRDLERNYIGTDAVAALDSADILSTTPQVQMWRSDLTRKVSAFVELVGSTIHNRGRLCGDNPLYFSKNIHIYPRN